MKIQSQFIKLPGERVNAAQAEAGLPQPESYSANFWIARDDIRGVMEVKNEQTGEMINSIVFAYSGDSFWCSLPAAAVMAILDQYDRKAMEQALIYPSN